MPSYSSPGAGTGSVVPGKDGTEVASYSTCGANSTDVTGSGLPPVSTRIMTGADSSGGCVVATSEEPGSSEVVIVWVPPLRCA